MAQTLKGEIKARIDASALRLFSLNGFIDTTVADIAQDAGVSVGNVYRYYPNKEEMFHLLVPPSFIRGFLSLLRSKYKTTDGRSLDGIMNYAQMILMDGEMRGLLRDNRERIIILLEKAEGTRYERFKGDLIDFMIRNVREYEKTMRGKGAVSLDKKKYALLPIIYDNLLRAVVGVLHSGKSEREMDELYNRLLSYHYGGMSRFLE